MTRINSHSPEMASHEEDEEDEEEEEQWGNYDVNDTEEDEAEAPLSVEAQRRQQEERKTWAPRRSKAKPRNIDKKSFKDMRRGRRKRVKAVPKPPVSSSSSSSSSSAAVIDLTRSSESSSSEDEKETEGDPLYLVYDDVTARALMPRTKDDDNKYLNAVKSWVKSRQGKIVYYPNSVPMDVSPHDEVFRRTECIPLSQLREDDMLDSYPHLAVPLRTIFVGFAFYDSELEEAVVNPKLMHSIQRLPLKLVPKLGLEGAMTYFPTVFFTLILGKAPFYRTKVFKKVAQQMPPAEYFADYPGLMMSMWDRKHTFFYAVDRPMITGLGNFSLYCMNLYAGGLLGEHRMHAPALLQHVIQLGLLPETRKKRFPARNSSESDIVVEVSGGAWSDFLRKGLYDPRLFMLIGEFINDSQKAKKQRDLLLTLMQDIREEPFFDPQRDQNADIFRDEQNERLFTE